MLFSRLFRFSLSVSLLFLLFLIACSDQPINLNQIITQEITSEPADIQNVEEPVYSEKLWRITDVLKQKEELHGQVVTIVGYAGLNREVANRWVVQLWNQPIGNYEDMWKYMRSKTHEKNEKTKWKTCWTDCWEEGKDFATIVFPSHYEAFRPEELPEPDPSITFHGDIQNEPEVRLKGMDKYVLKVFVLAWGGDALTLIEIVEHTEMPAEQPPESVNDGNPMTITELQEQYEDLYGQTVSVTGWYSGYSRNPVLTFGFSLEQYSHTAEDHIVTLLPYNEPAYLRKFVNHQGLKRGEQFTIRIHVYRPENHIVRIITPGIVWHEEFPFVIVWVDGDREENLSKAHPW